ncbi:MAG: hypothetical protein K0Q72_3799, partial [Armatimonadetes bacterium]|nr:hypothetical protein [Armatimonadota bacterium]
MSDFDEQSLQAFINDLQTGSLSYDQAKSRYRELGDAIRHRYEREVTALAVDMVHSGGAKDGDPLDGQLTFDAYHRWVEDALAHFGCEGSFTWSGDGLLAIFTHPHPAAAAGRHLIDSLPMFNARYNRTGRPLQIRLGVHTGPILTDEAGGIGKIASLTFDVAGHLQKAAAPNQMLVSETSYSHLGPSASDLLPVPPEMAGTGPCFAYPPHVTLMGAPALAAPPSAPPPSAPAPPPAASFVPWLLAVAGVAVAAGVIIAVTVVGPRGSSSAAPGAGGNSPAIAFHQEPAGAGPAAGNTPPGNTPAVAPPATPKPTPEPVAASLPQPRVPPAWEPSRLLWTSPAASSNLPPQLMPSPPEQKWLVSIGVGQYGDPNLTAPGAGSDARLVAAALQESGGVPPNHVHVLSD